MNPVPRDLMLPLPVGELVLQIMIVALFLLHIVFVNLMVGGAVFVALFEWLGIKWPRYDNLARKVARIIPESRPTGIGKVEVVIPPTGCDRLSQALEGQVFFP